VLISRLRFPFTLAIAALTVAFDASAQCPDGSAPPCRGAAAAAPRRAAPMPALDDATWIVVPFDNLAKAEDAEWLRGASVNLLYLDMSRWKDIRVIDDERVADLIRETPEASGASVMSLNAGIAVAKRAGAGKLVMGDVLKLGNRTTVTAKVFDVKTGQRMRSVKEDAVVQDSVMPLFGKLAQKILNVAPPAGANVGSLGTSRTDAYQEYLAGVTALNAFDVSGARRHLEKAIALDSSFALAHYKMAIVIGWDNSGAGQREHAQAAARYSAALPARVRGLIAGTLHQAKGEWTKACEVFGGLVQADPTDVEALYGMGECLYHDWTVVAVNGDTTNLRFNADWQRAIRAFTRVLELDPQYHLAYQHVIDALVAERQVPRQYCVEDRCRNVFGMNIRVGDSLVTTPVFNGDLARTRAQVALYQQTRSKSRNLDAARLIASQWVAAAPSEERALTALATVQLFSGHLAEADSILARMRPTGTLIEYLTRLLLRMDVAYKIGRTADAARLYDSSRASRTPMPNSPLLLGNAIAAYGTAFGRIAEWDSLFGVNVRAQNPPPQVAPFQARLVRVVMGAPTENLATLEQALFDITRTNRGLRSATVTIGGSLAYALRMPRAQWPALDTTVMDVKIRPAMALMRGDTTALRRAAIALDSAVQAVASYGGLDTGFTIAATEAYLALNDTAAALKAARVGLDAAMLSGQYFPQSTSAFTPAFFAPRVMVLRADLAAARGAKDEAREWYRRFIDAWANAQPEMQPLVERARRARAALAP
jgi:TolB-like protein